MIKAASARMRRKGQYLMVGLLCAWLAACAMPATVSPPASPTPAPTNNPSPSASPTASRPVALPAEAPTPTREARLCSPFPRASQADLIASISNPFNPPPPGSDDPHQGVDLAVQRDGIALAGGPVQAVLSGSVAMVTEDRFPYGFALLVETSLEALPAAWLRQYPAPTPAPTRPPPAALTCPAITPAPAWNETRRSLYLLYAHLQEKAAYQPGETIECGESIGKIGQSGNALHPHLHLEARIGPAGARFDSMAHYDNTARPEEMGSYCLWRVSDLFQLIDPLRLLAQLP